MSRQFYGEPVFCFWRAESPLFPGRKQFFFTAGYVSLLLFGISSPLDPHLSQKLFWCTTLQAVTKLLFLLQGARKDLCSTMSKGTWEQPPRKCLLIRPPYWKLTIILNVAADWTDLIDCSITPCRNEASMCFLSPFMILPYTTEVSGLILWLFCRRHNSDEVPKKFVVQLSVLAVLIGTSNDHGELL